jgi:hypothetical protein
MNIVVLIIAGGSAFPEYVEMEGIWRKYMNRFPNIRSYFIKMNPTLSTEMDTVIYGDTIWVRGDECLIPGILIKTVHSIRHLLAVDQFDYLVRTNMSSVLNLPLLYTLLEKHPSPVDYYGARHILNYVEGSCMVLSRRACVHLCDHADLQSTAFDDGAIGKTLYPHFAIVHHPKRDVLTLDQLHKLLDTEIGKYFHYRCKSKQHVHTCEIMTGVLQKVMAHFMGSVQSNTQPSPNSTLDTTDAPLDTTDTPLDTP